MTPPTEGAPSAWEVTWTDGESSFTRREVKNAKQCVPLYMLEAVAEMLEAESRRIVLPPADHDDAANRAEKSQGYFFAARYLRQRREP